MRMNDKDLENLVRMTLLELIKIAEAEGRKQDAMDPGGSVDRSSDATCAARWLRAQLGEP